MGEAESLTPGGSSSSVRSSRSATIVSVSAISSARAASSGAASLRSREMPAHAERRARRLGDRDEALGAERATATRVIGVHPDVVRPRHPRRALLDEDQRLRAQRLPRADLAGVRRRQQALGERAAGREGRVVRQPLANRGKLEHVERVTVHHGAG